MSMRSNDRRDKSQKVVSDTHDGSDGAADTRLGHGDAIGRSSTRSRYRTSVDGTTPARRDDITKNRGN
jgi:hypothetical protein